MMAIESDILEDIDVQCVVSDFAFECAKKSNTFFQVDLFRLF